MIIALTLEHPVNVGIHTVVNGISIHIQSDVTLLVGENGVGAQHHIVAILLFGNMQCSTLNYFVALLQVGQVNIGIEATPGLIEVTTHSCLVDELHRQVGIR